MQAADLGWGALDGGACMAIEGWNMLAPLPPNPSLQDVQWTDTLPSDIGSPEGREPASTGGFVTEGLRARETRGWEGQGHPSRPAEGPPPCPRTSRAPPAPGGGKPGPRGAGRS